MAASIIAVRTASYRDYESIAFEHLATLGVRNVEIPVPAAERVDETRAALQVSGLTATSMHGACDVARADIAESIAEQMPAFDALGTRYMFVSVKAGQTPLATAYSRLREAGEVAAAYGVTIVMETHPDLITNADAALQTIEAVGHNNVRVNFDTANLYFYNENVNAPAELRKIVRYVAAVHLKDTDGGFHHWCFPALGRGVVDFAETFRILDDAGFNGPCTLEIEGIKGEQLTERAACDRIAESIGFLRGLGRI